MKAFRMSGGTVISISVYEEVGRHGIATLGAISAATVLARGFDGHERSGPCTVARMALALFLALSHGDHSVAGRRSIGSGGRARSRARDAGDYRSFPLSGRSSPRRPQSIANHSARARRRKPTGRG